MRRTSSALSSLILIASLALVGGCKQSETVIVPPGEPVQLMETVQARVSTPDGKGGFVVSQNRVPIPAGWWVMPDLGTDGDGPTVGSPATQPAKR